MIFNNYIKVFMHFFGVIYFATAILIYFFKNEHSKNHPDDEAEYEKLSLYESYRIIWRLFSLKSVRELTFILLTVNVSTNSNLLISAYFI
jgi:hypothetical protein